MGKPQDLGSEGGVTAEEGDEGTKEVGVTIEAGAVTIGMTDITTGDLLHQVDTMREVMTVMKNMIVTTMVLLDTVRSLDIMTTILEIGTLGSTGIERGTTRTGIGGRKGTGRRTGTGTMTDTTGHRGIIMRGTGTMTGGMTGTHPPTTTLAAVGDLHPLGLHHIEDLTIRVGTLLKKDELY